MRYINRHYLSIYLPHALPACQPIRFLVYAGMTSSETLTHLLLPTFPVFRTSSLELKRRNSLFDHIVALDVRTPHRALSQAATAHVYGRPTGSIFPQPRLASAPWSSALLVDTVDHHRRRHSLQHPCWMVQGSSSWPLRVDATAMMIITIPLVACRLSVPFLQRTQRDEFSAIFCVV